MNLYLHGPDFGRYLELREALTQGDNRPVYMVLRHHGVEPASAIDALCAAGLRFKDHGVLCRDLTPGQLATIVQNAR